MLRLIVFFIFLLPMNLLAQDTELKFYRPFADQNLETTPIINQRIQGNCWQQSQRIQREDAWRCEAKSRVYDPCFKKPNKSAQYVLCFTAPWSNEAVQINLAEPLFDRPFVKLNMAETYPWALELMNGEKCLAVDPGQSYDGMQERYYCNNNTTLVGHLQRCKASWSILQHNQQDIVTVNIAKAWF